MFQQIGAQFFQVFLRNNYVGRYWWRIIFLGFAASDCKEGSVKEGSTAVSKKEVQQIVVKTVLWYDRNGNQLLVTNSWKENDDYWVVSWWWIDWFISWLITCWLVLKENVGRVKSWCFSIISIICYNLDLSNSLYRNNFHLLM